MRRFGILFGLLLCLAVVHVSLLQRVDRARRQLPVPRDHGYVLPGPLLGVVAGEYRGLAADVCFLQGMVAYGRTLEKGAGEVEERRIWQHVYRLLDASTDLDPYFFDPYYFANAVLNRKPVLVEKVNALLAKGVERRDWDWVLPFYLGFNYFYYLHDNIRAAEYLMLGARRPDAMPLLATLGARLAYRGNRTENAIVFLREILRNANDEKTQELYRTRLEALEKTYLLEQAVRLYRRKFDRWPKSLQTLLSVGLIAAIPEDPYGGSFYVTEDGVVKSTSDLTYAKGRQGKNATDDNAEIEREKQETLLNPAGKK